MERFYQESREARANTQPRQQKRLFHTALATGMETKLSNWTKRDCVMGGLGCAKDKGLERGVRFCVVARRPTHCYPKLRAGFGLSSSSGWSVGRSGNGEVGISGSWSGLVSQLTFPRTSQMCPFPRVRMVMTPALSHLEFRLTLFHEFWI